MKIPFLILVSCFLPSCVTTKYESKIDNPALLSDVTLYTNHYYGKGRSQGDVPFYKEIIYFNSRKGVIVLRPGTSDRLQRMSIGKWSMEKEDPEPTHKVTKTENSTRVKIRVQVPSTSSYEYDSRFENHLCLNIQYATCTEDNKNALTVRCYQPKKNCYLENMADPIGGYDGSWSYVVNHTYKEDFGRKYRKNDYRKINTFEVLREEKGDVENLQNQWKETKVAIQKNLKRIALLEKVKEEERRKATIAANSLRRKKIAAKKIVIPDGCKLAKAASYVTKGFSAFGGCAGSLERGEGVSGCIENAIKGVSLVGKERWVQGVRLICHPLMK